MGCSISKQDELKIKLNKEREKMKIKNERTEKALKCVLKKSWLLTVDLNNKIAIDFITKVKSEKCCDNNCNSGILFSNISNYLEINNCSKFSAWYNIGYFNNLYPFHLLNCGIKVIEWIEKERIKIRETYLT